MMGKLHSKHADCIFVNANLNKALEDNIWKKKTGFNLANYNMDETLSELSICLEEKSESSPLRVDLPPPKLDTETSKVLRLDHIGIRRAGRHGGKGKSKLNIEEFECGVQLEGSETAKQEWSFTLYDFDGHGRITKEDLASLLKALYDAVGSSIKLPPNGAKTLKLRLSVGQDGGAGALQQVTCGDGDVDCSTGNNNSNTKNNNSSGGDKNNFNNIASSKKNNIAGGASQTSGLASRVSERSRNTARTPNNKVREFSKLNNLTRAAAAEKQQQQQLVVKRTNEHRSGQQSRVASLPSAIQLAPPPSVCSGARDSGLFLPADLSSPVEATAAQTEGASASAEPERDDETQPGPSALALPDHQRLADLVQENMERNRVRQQLRRLGDHRSEGHQRYHHHPHYSHHSRQHRRRHHRTATATAVAAASSPQRPMHRIVSDVLATSTATEDGERRKNIEAGDARPGRRIEPSVLSHRWLSSKPNKWSHGEEAEEEDNNEEDGADTGCSKACMKLNCPCRRENVEKSKKTEGRGKKTYGLFKDDQGGYSKDGIMDDPLCKRQEGQAEESQDRRNYYLDLAGVENTSSRFHNSFRNPLGRVACSRRYHKGHHRSRSQDLATAHVTSGADVKLSHVLPGGALTNQCLGHCGRKNGLQDTNDADNSLCKPTSSNKCDNLLLSAVAFGLSLASDTPQLSGKCGKGALHKGEQITVGNSVVRMLTTSSRTGPVEYQQHGRSKSVDPNDATGENGEHGRRGQRAQKQSQNSEVLLQNGNSRTVADVSLVETSNDQSALNTNLNSLSFTLNASSISGSNTTTTTATTTTDNNISCPVQGRKFRPLSLPGHVPACVSPHHHRRHRHRDKDHNQAMQQVAQWIEREQHAWDQDTNGKTAAASAGGQILVQRHEHHHIHEHHHHHHYHHYHET